MSSEIKMKMKIKRASKMGDGRSEMGGPPLREASEGLRREVEEFVNVNVNVNEGSAVS